MAPRRTGPGTSGLVDVADEASVVGLVDAAVGFGGRIDGVVHAAGVAGGGPVHMLPTRSGIGCSG